MTRKNKSFKWTEKEKESFNTLKKAFRKGEIRQYFNSK
jgi:hypothetical protein